MENDFYKKRGRYKVAQIKYFDRGKNTIITENFGYSSVEEFIKNLHDWYIKFTQMENFLWIEVIFWDVKARQKFYQFQTIFEFYSFYSGILIAGELVK